MRIKSLIFSFKEIELIDGKVLLLHRGKVVAAITPDRTVAVKAIGRQGVLTKRYIQKFIGRYDILKAKIVSQDYLDGLYPEKE